MASHFQYRLQVLLDQKGERKEECERQLAACRQALREATLELDKLQARQAQIDQRKAAAREAIYEGEKDGIEIGQCVAVVQLLHRRLQDAKDAVLSQRIQIEELDEQVTLAAAKLAEANRELEILKKHRQKAERRFLAEMERKDAMEQDEIASTMFEARRGR